MGEGPQIQAPVRAADRPARESVRAAVLGGVAGAIPGLLLSGPAGRLVDTAMSEAARALAVVTTVGLVAGVLWWVNLRGHRKLFGRRFFAFFAIYTIVFSLAASADLLTGRLTLLGYEDEVPRDWLGLGRLGDWHYRFLPDAPKVEDFVVVILPSFDTLSREESRYQMVSWIQRAIQYGASAIAFDFYLEGESRLDGLLCEIVEEAKKEDVKVTLGYLHSVDLNLPVAKSLPEGLRRCVDDDQLGHLAGYLQRDGRVRMVPLFLGGDERMPSLSHRVADLVHRERRSTVDASEIPGLIFPRGNLVQFTYPVVTLPIVESSEWDSTDKDVLRRRLMLVGTSSAGDRHETPFGTLEGVVIHALAAQSLLTGHWIVHPERWTMFLMLYALCFTVFVVFFVSRSLRRTAIVVMVLSFFLLILAVVLIRWWLLWIDVGYSFAAMWGLWGLFALVTRRGSFRLAGRTLLLNVKRRLRAVSSATGGTGDGGSGQAGL